MYLYFFMQQWVGRKCFVYNYRYIWVGFIVDMIYCRNSLLYFSYQKGIGYKFLNVFCYNYYFQSCVYNVWGNIFQGQGRESIRNIDLFVVFWFEEQLGCLYRCVKVFFWSCGVGREEEIKFRVNLDDL